jgi:alpha-glucan,water dikinase
VDFHPGMVGAKALDLASLRQRLAAAPGAEAVGVPASVSLPYGTFERVLAEEPRNAETAAEVERLAAAAAAGGVVPPGGAGAAAEDGGGGWVVIW